MPQNENQMDDLLNDITEALFAEQYDIDHIIEEYDVPKSNINGLVELIGSLRGVLTEQQPSDEFVSNLKRELTGQQDGMFARLRYLPGRVQLAAGLALVAGFVLISRRRLTGDETTEDPAEIPALQQ